MNNKEKLRNKLLSTLVKFKKTQIHNNIGIERLSQNEKLAMLVLINIHQKKRVPLIKLREEICLAPSTVTPIIAKLETEGYVKREIDLEDRRNIYINITETGLKCMKNIKENVDKRLYEYINYIGEEDSQKAYELLTKTIEFFREEKKEKI